MLKPISEILTSPKLHENVSNRLTEMKENVKSSLMPTSFQNRPPVKHRKGLVMDRNWWFYNICLSCMPALLIAVMCYHEKGNMEKFYDDQRLLDQKRIYGDDYIPPAEVQEESKRDGESKAWIGTTFYNSLVALVEYMPEGLGEAATSLVRDVDEKTDEPTSTNITSTVTKESPETQTLSDIIHRIQILEERTGASDQSLTNKPLSPEYRLKRLQQSGIRNRIDDRLIDQWKKEERDLEQDRKGDNKTKEEEVEEALLPLSRSGTMWMGMKLVIKQKGNELIDNVALAIGYTRDASKTGDDALRSMATNIGDASNRNHVDLMDTKNNGSNDPYADFEETSIGQNVVSPLADNIDHAAKETLGNTKTSVPRKMRSWIWNIVTWKRRPTNDIQESNRGDEPAQK